MSERIRVGVAGLGGWGQNVLRTFVQDTACEVAWICDRDTARLSERRTLCPSARPTPEFDDLLRDDSVQAVAIATPAPAHFSMTREALLAGKHVFVEKPMTLRAVEAEELTVLSEDCGRKLMVGHLLEYHPAVEAMKRQIASGRIGELLFMYTRRLNLGIIRTTESAWWSLAPHDISVTCYLLGEEPSAVVADGMCGIQRDIEDTVWATLHFPSGRAANIHVSWLDAHKERKMVLVGTRGMLVFDELNSDGPLWFHGCRFDRESTTRVGTIPVSNGTIEAVPVANEKPLTLEISHFVESILQDTPPRSDGADGLRVVRVLEQGEEQLANKRGSCVVQELEGNRHEAAVSIQAVD